MMIYAVSALLIGDAKNKFKNGKPKRLPLVSDQQQQLSVAIGCDWFPFWPLILSQCEQLLTWLLEDFGLLLAFPVRTILRRIL